MKDPVAQSIIDAFTKHYGILKIFQLMIHFGFLAENCEKTGAIDLIADILSTALNYFHNEPNISHLTMEEKFNASNVPRQNLLRQIRQLEMFVRIKLNSYRFHFPRTGSSTAGNPELTSLLKMLRNLTTFRNEILQIESFDTINDLVEDCCRKFRIINFNLRNSWNFNPSLISGKLIR